MRIEDIKKYGLGYAQMKMIINYVCIQHNFVNLIEIIVIKFDWIRITGNRYIDFWIG